MNKRVFRIMIALLLAAFVPKAYGQEAGAGTAESSILISDATGLANIKNGLDKHYKLKNDINLTSNWAPLDTFTGTLDGCGFVISGLNVTVTGTDNAGLFGAIGIGGTVKNLGVTGTSVTSASGYAGGIAGENNGTIRNCYTNVAVTSTSTAGGIAGRNIGTILNCYTTGAVTSEGIAGGIAGVNAGVDTSAPDTIQYCYSTGAISGKEAGGISGTIDIGGAILNCIALNSSITGDAPKVGRITGVTTGDHTLTANYAAPSISGTWEATDKDGAKKDGADLTTDNFISSNSAFAGEWTTDSNWKFADKDFTNLPKLMTTGLTPNKEIGVQTAIKRTDYIGLVLIEGPVAYNTNLHKGKDIIISPTGILTVDAEAQVNSLEIQQGGQVRNTQALSVTKTITTTRTLANKWITFGTPIEMAAAPTTSTYALTGYAKANAANQKWATAEVIPANTLATIPATIPANTAHLLAADKAETVLTFIASGTDGSALRIPVAKSAPTGEALNTGIFLFRMNPSLCNQTMKNIYTLSADGAYFELQKTDYTLKPFECYLTANTATQTAVLSLRAGGDLPTGNELPALPSDAFRIWGDNGQLHMDASQLHDVKIYNLSGSLLHSFRLDGQRALTLGRGIYLVHSNNITYKVSL